MPSTTKLTLCSFFVIDAKEEYSLFSILFSNVIEKKKKGTLSHIQPIVLLKLQIKTCGFIVAKTTSLNLKISINHLDECIGYPVAGFLIN